MKLIQNGRKNVCFSLICSRRRIPAPLQLLQRARRGPKERFQWTECADNSRRKIAFLDRIFCKVVFYHPFTVYAAAFVANYYLNLLIITFIILLLKFIILHAQSAADKGKARIFPPILDQFHRLLLLLTQCLSSSYHFHLYHLNFSPIIICSIMRVLFFPIAR